MSTLTCEACRHLSLFTVYLTCLFALLHKITLQTLQIYVILYFNSLMKGQRTWKHDPGSNTSNIIKIRDEVNENKANRRES